MSEIKKPMPDKFYIYHDGYKYFAYDSLSEYNYYHDLAPMSEAVSIANYQTLSEKLAANEAKLERLEVALNKIGMLASSELAYTSEFTTLVQGIVRGALK